MMLFLVHCTYLIVACSMLYSAGRLDIISNLVSWNVFYTIQKKYQSSKGKTSCLDIQGLCSKVFENIFDSVSHDFFFLKENGTNFLYSHFLPFVHWHLNTMLHYKVIDSCFIFTLENLNNWIRSSISLRICNITLLSSLFRIGRWGVYLASSILPLHFL